MEEIKALLEAMESRINQRLDSMESWLDKIEGKLNDFQSSTKSRFDTLDTKLGRVETAVAEVKETVTRIETEHAMLEKRIKSHSRQIGELRTDVDTLLPNSTVTKRV
ncbi:hypothetical protein [Effusibacillus consociatus]|uniref:Uncharacterized protein n=1 Tax=Effusibacillus consociatus TaxID=1117041 RepID=A0ABV9Q9E2_9BACL